MKNSIEPEVGCHEAKGCEGRLYSVWDEECRACAGEEPIPFVPPDCGESDYKFGVR